jgi:hypothetical protein
MKGLHDLTPELLVTFAGHTDVSRAVLTRYLETVR